MRLKFVEQVQAVMTSRYNASMGGNVWSPQ